MSPRKEDQKQLIRDILVGNIEIMFERRQVNVSVDLIKRVSTLLDLNDIKTNILLHVFCSMLKCCLADLKPHLRRGVRHEPAICTKGILTTLRSLCRVWISIALLLWWLRCGRWRS